MKRTLALLIAVLMVVAILPLSTFAAAAQTVVGAPTTQATPTPAPEQNATEEQQTPPAPTPSDYFALYDADGKWVAYYATLTEADAAIKDGYTLKLLQDYTAQTTHVWGEGRGTKSAPIRYTVDGALANGGNAVVTVTGSNAAFGWLFNEYSAGDQITLKNITMITVQGAIFASVGANDTQIDLTLENCKLYAGNSYYEVNPNAYAEAPAENAYYALGVNGVALSILGEQTVLRATAGAALQTQNAQVYVEDGYFYSSLAEKTVMISTSALVVMNASVVNNVQSALYVQNASAYVHGGTFAVAATGANAGVLEVGAVHADAGAYVALTGARVAVSQGVYALAACNGGAMQVFAADLAASAQNNKFFGDVDASLSTGTETEADISVSVVGEGSVDVPAHTVATSWQVSFALNVAGENALEIYNAAGALIAYLPLAFASASLDAQALELWISMIPNGGKLLVKTETVVVTDTIDVCPGFPKMAIAIEGASDAPVVVYGGVPGYLLKIRNSMDVMLKNIVFHNTLRQAESLAKLEAAHADWEEAYAAWETAHAAWKSAGGAKDDEPIAPVEPVFDDFIGRCALIGSDANAALIAKDASLVLDARSAFIAEFGEAAHVGSGATLKVKEGASVFSKALPVGESAAVVLEGDTVLELNGGILNAAQTQGASTILTKVTTRSAELSIDAKTLKYSYTLSHATIRLNAGEVFLPGELSSLHQVTAATAVVDMTMTTSVQLKVGDRDNPTVFKNKAFPVELQNAVGERIGLYASIADALNAMQALVAATERNNADIGTALIEAQASYTVKLLEDHVETGVFKTDFEELVWKLDGNGHTLYMPEVNYYGMEFAGKNTIAKIENLTLCSAGSGITVNPASTAAGVGVIANNVVVYAGGSSKSNPDAYVGDVVSAKAFRVENKGGELIVLGENSTAYLNGQGLKDTSLFYNAGFLSIYGGTYEAPVSYVIECNRSIATYVAGGNFISGEGNLYTIYNYASGVTIIAGGNIVTKSGNTFQISSGSITIFGGNFYHLSDAAFGAWAASTSMVQYWGGNFFTMKGADKEQNFIYNITMKAEVTITAAVDYKTTDADAFVDADLDLVKESVTYNAEWLEENGYTEGDYTFKVYTGNGDDFFGVYGPDFVLATQVVGAYNGKIELQKDIDILHTSYTSSRQLGPIADVTITSAPGNRFTYASSNYSGASTGSVYFMWLNGGNWTFENMKLANYGSQLLQVNANSMSRTTVIVAEMGEISGHTSGILLCESNTRLIVKEGGFVNASANQNELAGSTVRDHLAASSNLVRLTGGSDVYVAGYLGYYPADADHAEPYLPNSGSFRCINYNGGADAVAAGAGEQCVVHIAPTAKLGTPIGSKSLSVININISDYTVSHDVVVEAAAAIVDGKTVAPTFTTDGCVMNATAGAQLKLDGIVIQNTVPALDGSFSANDYAFLMSGAGGEFKNINYYGSKFMSVDSRGMAKQDALTIVFDGDNRIVGKGSAILWNVAATCNTDIVINNGYYQSEAGNFSSSAADAVGGAVAEGKLIVNGGTFYKDNGNNYSMFLSYGSYDIEVNGGFFHMAYNALMFSMAATSGKAVCTTELTINGGEFEICRGVMYSDESETNETKLTINDCVVKLLPGGTDYTGAEVVFSDQVLRVGGKCQAVINGGEFTVDANKRVDVLMTRHNARVTINDWTVKHSASAESPIRVTGTSELVVNGGWIESNARFVVRTMAGNSSNGTASGAILKVYGGTMILNPSHPALNVSTSDSVIANGGSTEYGHVYIYGGQFINKNDADPLTSGGNYSRQVLARINTYGDFQIYGGIMIAGVKQDFFYNTEVNSTLSTGISVPGVDIPIIKGITPKYVEEDGREFYYTVYGAGDSLLVPEIQTNVEADITENASGLVFTAAMDAIHYDALITWARSYAYAYNKEAESYALSYGMLVTTTEDILKTFGVVSVEALQNVGGLCLDKPATAADSIPNADGSLDISATVENISQENKTVQYIAVPYVEITLGVGTAAVFTQRYYGEYNSNAGVASMAGVAATILRDNTDVKIGEYQHSSLMVPNAFNRYSVEQQSVLMTYLVHEHNYDYTGTCQDQDCGEKTAVELTEGVAEQIFAESGLVKFYKLQLKKGVAYSIGFTKDILSYTLYDKNGATCNVASGIYTAVADGTYYLRADAKRAGNTQLIVSHIHMTDYLGMCSVCEQCIANEIQPEQTVEGVFVKNNYYVFKINLTQGITYELALINGAATLYDAQGVELALDGNSFTCEADGTYYIKAKAIYTAKGSIAVTHKHAYNNKGVCAVCDVDACVAIENVYEYTAAQRVQTGEQAFFCLYMEAGRTYSLVFNQHFGIYTIFDAEDQAMTLGSSGFECEKSGIYYFVLDIQNDVSLQIRIDASHGEDCVYNNKGECEFVHADINGNDALVSCGKTAREQLLDSVYTSFYLKQGEKKYFYFNYAGAGVSYNIELTDGVRYILCDADGDEIRLGENADELISYLPGVSADGKTNDIYRDEDTDRILYVVVEAEEAKEVTLRVSHVHVIDYRGVCSVKDTTTNESCSVRKGKMLSVDTAENVTFVAGEKYYYEVLINAAAEYRVILGAGVQATWTLMDTEGNVVFTSEQQGAYIPEFDGYYYLVMTATADSVADDVLMPATVTVSAHKHAWNNMGACSCGAQKEGYIIDLDALAEVGGLRAGQLTVGVYYLKATMTAGKSYTLKASKATYKLYGGADATVEMTVTNDTFVCVESGVYYYVLTVAQTTTANDSVAYTITPDLPVAHVHSFTSPYHYVKEGNAYYQVVDKCDFESCNMSQRVLVSVVNVNTTLELDYKARDQRSYVLSLVEGVRYEFKFVNSNVEWKLLQLDGTVITTQADGDFDCLASGVYYLEVTAKSDSFEQHGVKSSLTVVSHKLDVKGEYVEDDDNYIVKCTDPECEYVVVAGSLDAIIAAGGLAELALTRGVHYYYANMTANKVYTLKLSGNATYKVYNDKGELQTVTNGEFTCPADGTYYYVVTMPVASEEAVTMEITIVGELHFAHVHSYTLSYYYQFDAETKTHYRVTSCDVKEGETACTVLEITEVSGVTALELNTTKSSISYTKGNTYYYLLRLVAGTDYLVTFTSATVSWRLVNRDGTVLAPEALNVIRCVESGTYYLEVTAEAASSGTTLAVTSHRFGHTGICPEIHSKKECTINLQEQLADLIDIGGLWIGTIAQGTYFIHAKMEAGKTYTLKFDSATMNVTYVLYNGSGTAQEVIEDAFTCESAGDYYYVVTVVEAPAPEEPAPEEPAPVEPTPEEPAPEESAPVMDRVSLTITPDDLVEIHNFVGAYSYLEKDGKYYRVIPCKEDGCEAEKYVEIEQLLPDEVIDVNHYLNGDLTHYAIVLEANTYYVITVLGVKVEWQLIDADGQVVADHTIGAFDCVEGGVYYLAVLAKEHADDPNLPKNPGEVEPIATLLVDPVHHCVADECTDPNCPHKRGCNDLGELLGDGEIASGYMDAGTYYFFLEMTAGKTYTLAFTNEDVSYQLFSTVSGKKKVVDNAFACEESGLYYFVVTIPDGTTGRDTFRFTVADTVLSQ